MEGDRVIAAGGEGLAAWRAMAGRRPLVAFFVLALGFTWVYFVLVLGLLHAPVMPWAIPGTFGPAIAGFLMAYVTGGREGVQDLRRTCWRWRVGARWYLLAGLVLPALVVACGLYLPGGTDAFAGRSVSYVVVAYLSQLFVIMLGGGGLNEEPGWRGFALPRLQRAAGPLEGSLVLGLLWGFWHLPIYVYTPNYNGAGTGFAGLAPMFLAFVVCTAALSVIFTWLYNRVSGSVFFMIFAHASFNAATMWAPASSRAYNLIVYALAVVLAVVVAAATRGRLGWREGVGSEAQGSEASSVPVHVQR